MRSLFEFFKQLEIEAWSGEVQVTSSQGNALILLSKGQLVWAHRPIDRAVERLHRMNWVKLPPREVLKDISQWDELVRILLQKNSGRYQAIVRYLTIERLEVFYRVFFWSNVEVFPHSREVFAPSEAELGFYQLRPLTPLLKEAKARLEEWPEIQRRIGSSKRIFLCQVELPEEPKSKPDAVETALEEGPGAGLPANSPFSEEQLQLLRQCNGRNTVHDIVQRSPDGEFLVLRRLAQLWEKGFIAPKDDDGVVRVIYSNVPLISIKDFIGMIVVVCASVFLLGAFHFLIPRQSVAKSIPQNLMQALDIYRRIHDRYPLTLRELEEEGFISQEASKDYYYKLTNPRKYKLLVKDI